MLYLIAYDIAAPKRLAGVARRLERGAVRCQKSVFLFRGDRPALEALLAEVAPLLRLTEDVIQAWKLAGDERPLGLCHGTPIEASPGGVVLAPSQSLFVNLADPEP